MAYLGTFGRLVELKCPETQQVSFADRVSFETTLEGRVKSQSRPIGRRTWQLSTSPAATPQEQATILGFIAGEWGPGPFVFVSADAPLTNLLTPRAATCAETVFPESATNGGPMALGDGQYAGRSLTTLNSTPSGMYFGGSGNEGLVPVLPDMPVTGSAWLQGVGAKIRLNWYDANGSYLSSFVASSESAGAGVQRLSVTGVPPSGAASCRLLAVGPAGMRGTRPAVTWTEKARDWGPGEGCSKATIHGATKDVTLAAPGAVYAGLSFTVTEVG